MAEGGQRARAKLQTISITGGLLQLQHELSSGDFVEIAFHTRSGAIRGMAEMLNPTRKFQHRRRQVPPVAILSPLVRTRMTSQTITHSAEETIAFGRSLAAELDPPLVVLLRGDLGAGKTTLVKGIAEGFGAARAEDVTSPTFTLVHEYRGPHVTLYHVDLYRIDTQRELETLGLDDLLAPNSILLIEWGEKFPRLQRDQNMEITLERMGETERKIQRTTC